MHSHGPNCLEGPIRGTPGWWKELGKKSKQGKLALRKKRGKRSSLRNRARAAGAQIRLDLVDKVRREIAAGTYETQEKWEAALDRLLENLPPDE